MNTNFELNFNKDDLATAVVCVKIAGQKKHFGGVDLLIKKPLFAEIQNSCHKREVRINDDNYCIKLEELFLCGTSPD